MEIRAKLSKISRYILNLASFSLLIYLAYQQLNIYYKNTQAQGHKILQHKAWSLSKQEEIDFPLSQKNSLIIVWASWCAPCKLEMLRIKNSVKNGGIPVDRVFAINPYESSQKIQEFVQKNNYPFHFIKASDVILKDIILSATPSFIWLKGENIDKVSTGVNFIGIFLMENFLKHHE